MPKKNTVIATIDNENGTQDLRYDVPKPGDTVEFYNPHTLVPSLQSKVKETKINEKEWNATISFEDDILEKIGINCIFTKINNTAFLRFAHSHVNTIRARALLIQTKEALIENNIIEKCTGTGIHINTALGWCESTACDGVKIRNNIIRDCGYGDATFGGAAGIAVQTKCRELAVGVHKNVEIEHNQIYGSGRSGILLSCLKNSRVWGNKIENCSYAIVVESSDCIELWDNEVNGGKILYQTNRSLVTLSEEKDDYTLIEFETIRKNTLLISDQRIYFLRYWDGEILYFFENSFENWA